MSQLLVPFHTSTSAKWVLTGEHAVLRGIPAIALPYSGHSLQLTFTPSQAGSLQISPAHAASVIQTILSDIAEDFKLPSLSGDLEISGDIPQGSGLGSSAALCVALSRWLAPYLDLSEADIPGFATRLENHFHGQSSGMDVSVIASQTPVQFVRGKGSTPLQLKRLPRFTLHDTGIQSRTKDCIEKVTRIHTESEALGRRLDEAMGAATKKAYDGLLAYNDGRDQEGLNLLTQAIQQANQCFLSWRLVPHEVWKLQDQLREEGALATKLTGAGDGGYLVALWPS